MGEAAKRVLQEALSLPLSERRDLAAQLVDTIDEPDSDSSQDWDSLWRAELDARLTEMKSGSEEEVSLADVRRRLGAIIGR